MIVIRSGREAADHFRRLREYHGLSREELARRLWVDRRTVYDRDNGRSRLTADALIEAAAAFGFRVALIPGELDDDDATAAYVRAVKAGALTPDRRPA